ncbi:MAG TPA: PBP1A family penicillin-binding protein, partial [Kofleriaceae bacterium]
KSGKGPRPPRKKWVTIVKWGAIAALIGTALMATTVAFTFWMYGRDPKLPRIEKLADYKPKQVTTIVDKNDQRIGEIFTQRRTYVPYEKIPPILVDSFIAAEDNNYWSHEGVDYFGMVRAFFANLRAGKTTQGASTITQQVVKNFLLTPERSFKRKIQEIILARRLEKALTKQEILTLYLNEIYFGGRRYGVQEAARFYFGKDVSQINPGEAAVLASLPKEPETFYRALKQERNPGRVKDRQVYVLNQLVKMGKLAQPEAKKWIDEPIKIVKDPFPFMKSAPEWVDLVKGELKNKGVDTDTAGAIVRTTLDPSLQQQAQKALQAGLRAVDARHKIGRAKRNVGADKLDLEIAKLAKRLPSGGPKAKEVYEAIVTAVHDADHEIVVDLGKWPAAIALGTPEDARFNPADDSGKTKTPSERFKVGDVVDVQLATTVKKKDDDDDEDVVDVKVKHAQHRVAFAPGPEGAVVIMEVKTRKVRALVGGYTSKVGGFNRAINAHRQPGSSFKPYVYSTAIDSGKYTPASRVNDAPEVFDLWKPKNFESGKFEGPVLLRHALAKSINTVAIRVTYDMKPENVAAMAHKLGIVSELPKEMSLALGSGEVTPLEHVNAIATIAAGGIAMAPRFVEAIDGKATAQPQGSQVMRPEVAYVVTSMMQSVVQEGTATKAAVLKIPIAGKTGTSNDARDTWFVGFTPDYIICVWLGYDDNRSMGRETGGSAAVPVFVDIMKAMQLPAKQFGKPAHVVEKVIDRETGLVAPEGAPKSTTLTEVFIEGTEPMEVAPKPGEVTEGSSVTGEYGD